MTTIQEFWETLKAVDYGTLFQYALQEPFNYALIALVILILVLLVLGRLQPKMFTANSAEAGKVFVSRKAIKNLAVRTCRADERIARSRVHVNARGRNLKLHAVIKLRSGYRLNEASKSLQQTLEMVMQRNIGLENIGRIDVTVKGFIGKEAPDMGPDDEDSAEGVTSPPPTRALATAAGASSASGEPSAEPAPPPTGSGPDNAPERDSAFDLSTPGSPAAPSRPSAESDEAPADSPLGTSAQPDEDTTRESDADKDAESRRY